MKTIPLNGKYSYLCALVDDEDYAFIKLFKWYGWKHTDNKMYVRTFVNGKKALAMHRVVMRVKDKSEIIDHINHDGLNNTKSNLRIVSNRENLWNSRKLTPSSSIYKGVTWDKQSRRWKARIYCNKTCYTLGLFRNEDEAGKAYFKAAYQYYGEYANPVGPSVRDLWRDYEIW